MKKHNKTSDLEQGAETNLIEDEGGGFNDHS